MGLQSVVGPAHRPTLAAWGYHDPPYLKARCLDSAWAGLPLSPSTSCHREASLGLGGLRGKNLIVWPSLFGVVCMDPKDAVFSHVEAGVEY